MRPRRIWPNLRRPSMNQPQEKFRYLKRNRGESIFRELHGLLNIYTCICKCNMCVPERNRGESIFRELHGLLNIYTCICKCNMCVPERNRGESIFRVLHGLLNIYTCICECDVCVSHMACRSTKHLYMHMWMWWMCRVWLAGLLVIYTYILECDVCVDHGLQAFFFID